MVMFGGLVDDWRQAGLESGDTVLIHSSLKRTLKKYAQLGETLTMEVVLDSFLEAVGTGGTLLLPLFNFDFCQGKAFDIRQTPSQMGMLTELARMHPRAIRTGHPIYSFAVIGKHASMFQDVCNASAYGSQSPFQMLRDLNGKIGVLNLPGQQSMTFYHHIEEIHGVDYRYEKWFEADYTGWDGITSRGRFSIFVRDLERGVETHVEPMDDLLWEKGFWRGSRYDQGHGFRTILATDVFEEVSRIIESGKAEGTLYRIHKEAGL